MRKIVLLLFMPCLLIACSENTYPTHSMSSSYPEMYNFKPHTILIMPLLNRTSEKIDSNVIASAQAVQLSEKGYYVLPASLMHQIIQQDSLECLPDINPAPCKDFKERFGIDALLFISVNQWKKDFANNNLTEEYEYSLVSTATGKELWYYTSRVTESTASDIPVQSNNSDLAGMCVELGCGILANLFVSAVATALTTYTAVSNEVTQKAFGSMPAGKYNPRYLLDASEQIVIDSSWKDQNFGNRAPL